METASAPGLSDSGTISGPRGTSRNWSQTIIAAGVVLFFVYTAELVLAILLFSVLLAFILSPVVAFLQTLRLPRAWPPPSPSYFCSHWSSPLLTFLTVRLPLSCRTCPSIRDKFGKNWGSCDKKQNDSRATPMSCPSPPRLSLRTSSPCGQLPPGPMS